MRLAATNLSLPFNADESALMMLLASELRVKQEDIQSLRITRHSLDARDKADIRSIYSVSFELSTENAKRVALLGLKNVGKLPERSEREPEQGTVPQDAPAVVVGLGPAGLFAQVVLDAGDDDALTALKDVGEHIAAGLAGAAGADDAVVVVQPRDPCIVADTWAFV